MGITLYFSTHEAEAITPRLRQLYDAANIVLLEQDYQEEDDLNLNLLNELSRGNVLIDDVLKITSGPHGQMYPGFTNGILAMVYRSGKRILLERSPYSVYDAAEQYALARKEFRNMPLAKACRLLAENLAKRAENQKKRDEALTVQLAEVVAQEPSSNILVLRGFGHKPSLEKALTSQSVAFTSVTSHKALQGFLCGKSQYPCLNQVLNGHKKLNFGDVANHDLPFIESRLGPLLKTCANLDSVFKTDVNTVHKSNE